MRFKLNDPNIVSRDVDPLSINPIGDGSSKLNITDQDIDSARVRLENATIKLQQVTTEQVQVYSDVPMIRTKGYNQVSVPVVNWYKQWYSYSWYNCDTCYTWWGRYYACNCGSRWGESWYWAANVSTRYESRSYEYLKLDYSTMQRNRNKVMLKLEAARSEFDSATADLSNLLGIALESASTVNVGGAKVTKRNLRSFIASYTDHSNKMDNYFNELSKVLTVQNQRLSVFADGSDRISGLINTVNNDIEKAVEIIKDVNSATSNTVDTVSKLRTTIKKHQVNNSSIIRFASALRNSVLKTIKKDFNKTEVNMTDARNLSVIGFFGRTVFDSVKRRLSKGNPSESKLSKDHTNS